MESSMDITDNSSQELCDLEFPKEHQVLIALTLSVIALVGMIGNFILSFFVIRNTEMQSLINILLATMSISDTVISFVCAPLDIITIIYGEWIFGMHMCCIHSFTLSVLVVQNVTILVIISIDRYYILVHKKDMLRGCKAAAMIPACTVFSVAVSCPPLFGVGKVVFANEHCRQIFEETNGNNVYSMLYSGFLFVLPCGLLLLAYVHIIMTIRKTARRIRPAFHQPISRVNPERQQRIINVKFKQKTFSTILCLYAAAMLCKLPLAFSIFIKSLTKFAVCPVSHWIMLLTYLNPALNPFIYALKISEYWMMLTGKFHDVKNRVKSFRRSRHRSEPQNIYMITVDISSSVI